MFNIRENIFKAAIYLSFVFLAANLFSLQVINYPIYRQRSLKNRIRIIPLEAPRGVIYDRNNNILVGNRISFDLAVIQQEVEDIDATLEELSKVSGISKEQLHKNYQRNYIAPFIPVIVAQDLDKHKAFCIDENITSVPGAILWSNPRRDYKHPEAISHLVGYIGKMDVAEYGILSDYGYRIREYVGRSGLEDYYNSYLRGESGGIQVEVDALSRQVRQLSYKAPEKGKDIYLTIDIDLQEMANMLLKDETGAFIAMDAKTGQVLALASSPNFDPNVFVNPAEESKRLVLLNRKDHPMLNRAISSAYPPGSTFKIVVATAALSSGKLNEKTLYYCHGIYRLGKAKFRCWRRGGHGTQNVIQGLAHSCNIFFYNAGRLIGPDLIYQYAMKFGLGQPTGIDLPWEAAGFVPSPFWKRRNKGKPWHPGDTLNLAIGQGFLLITPIQGLKMITFIANKGLAPRPYLVKRIGEVDLQGESSDKVAIEEENNAFSIIQNGLYDVVNDPTGTGQNARVKGLKICGKTGTAQVEGAEAHGWFLGYLPADNPKISFAIFLEHCGSGGRKPATMARVLCKYLQKKGYLE